MPLGTGGGLYHFRDQILAGGPEAFFVLNADVCSDFPLTAMLDSYRHQPHPFLLLGTTVRGPGGLEGVKGGDPEKFLECRVSKRQRQPRELEGTGINRGMCQKSQQVAEEVVAEET